MKTVKYTPMQRVMTALSHKEADRVPSFLLLTMHGAKELGLSIKEYFSKAEYVSEGQVRLQKKYSNDCLYTFFYISAEIEAWGGEVIFSEDGPVNCGEPIIKRLQDISDLEIPKIEESITLKRILNTIEILKRREGHELPVIGAVASPFSLAMLQLGFEKCIDCMYDEPQLFKLLISKNEQFCINWANAQIGAGANVITYFDPMSSTSITPKEYYFNVGQAITQRIVSQVNGPVAIHMGSGRSMPILGSIAETGVLAVATSTLEDIGKVKGICKDKLTVIGNLNAVDMPNWTREMAHKRVRDTIAKAGPGGGFILSDNHGEIPLQVPDEVIGWISEAVQKWGRYPLDWVGSYEK